MSSITTTSTTATAPPAAPRILHRVVRWVTAVAIAVALAILATGVLSDEPDVPGPVVFDEATAISQLTAMGYLTPEGVRDDALLADLQNRGLVPAGPPVSSRTLP